MLYNAETETLIGGDAVVTLDGRACFNPEYVDAKLATSTEELLRSLKVRHLEAHREPSPLRPLTTCETFREVSVGYSSPSPSRIRCSTGSRRQVLPPVPVIALKFL